MKRNPSSLSYVDQPVGTTSLTQAVTVTNTGNAPLVVTGIASTNAAFAATSDCATAPIAPGNTCAVYVTFTPSAATTTTATLHIADNAADSAQPVALSGFGFVPTIWYVTKTGNDANTCTNRPTTGSAMGHV